MAPQKACDAIEYRIVTGLVDDKAGVVPRMIQKDVTIAIIYFGLYETPFEKRQGGTEVGQREWESFETSFNTPMDSSSSIVIFAATAALCRRQQLVSETVLRICCSV